MQFKWLRLYKKNGIEFMTRYETSKEAIRDVVLGRDLKTSITIGVCNLNTDEEWTGEKLEQVVNSYRRKYDTC
jgi:alpha-glucuronidase